MRSEQREAERTSVSGPLAPPRTESTAAVFTFEWRLEDQGDLTEEQAISEAQAILANPDAHEWLPWKASPKKPDA